jgi:formate hydrogenlyase subunit 6/NADH:ubiquinone oxidoreductase subunit I
LVIGAKLISLSLRRQRGDYEPDRGACVACARCVEYCPNELSRRGVVPAPAVPAKLSQVT